jgi:hypothetical protein
MGQYPFCTLTYTILNISQQHFHNKQLLAASASVNGGLLCFLLIKACKVNFTVYLCELH